ncbi:MAG TPA: histidine ammonia-lyase, partial [Candidatus Dormibacteraeota bacterium]|nr:histidine ammonia-lyase [Candidatus Dormibacteraeota bacterium]
TGFGALADVVVDPRHRARLQRAVVLSHSAGLGDFLDDEVVRGMTLLRARSLAAGLSGVRPLLVEAMAAVLDSGLRVLVPEHGSLGASGDLAPLAHVAAFLLGEGSGLDAAGHLAPASSLLAEAGLRPVEIGAKEGLALINGTDGSAALLAIAVHDLDLLLVAADCAAALSVEALLATDRAFQEEIVSLRPSEGQARSAANLRALLTHSEIVASHRDSPHAVQDAYSLRCAPQVHGAARDAVAFARSTVDRELAAVVDNPIVLPDRGELRSGGNFHAQALAYAADLCASVCADIAAISERRVDRLLDPTRSRGLPPCLTPEPGVNSGLMITQYTAAGLVTRLRKAASPLAVESASTSAGQEDHVSMSWEAALRTRESVEDLRRVLAVEVVCGAQALDLRQPLRPGPATGALHASLRTAVPVLTVDRIVHHDLRAAEEWLRSGEFRAAAEAAAGRLG